MMRPSESRRGDPALHLLGRGATLFAALSFVLLLGASLLLLRVPTPASPIFSHADEFVNRAASAVPAAVPAPFVADDSMDNSGQRFELAAHETVLSESDSARDDSLPSASLRDRFVARRAQAALERPTAAPSVGLVFDDPPAARPLDRSAERRAKRIAQFGGTIDTENAVEAGLLWLVEHQESDGHWDRVTYRKLCPPGAECTGWALTRTSSDLDAGLTGLCLLAFLGAGYTDRDGPHQKTVQRAVEWLLEKQNPLGGFSSDDSMAGYNDSVATFALAEFYALTNEKAAIAPLERAVRRLATAQQDAGGWDYLPRASSARNDTSISAWAVQALHAAAAAGIPVSRRALVKAALHFARATADDGRVWYADAGTGFKIDDQLDASYRFGPAMTACGLTCTQLLGWRSDAATVRKQLALLAADRPSTTRMQRADKEQLHDYYYWYYGTIATFQVGGEAWERWNAALRDEILPLQQRDKTATGKKKHGFGSWPPYGNGWGKWGRSGSRVYTTAIAVLTLEIYYRHSPVYLEEPPMLTASDWRAYLPGASVRERRLGVRALADMRSEISEAALLDMAGDAEPSVAAPAAEALVAIGSPMARPPMEIMRDRLPPLEREKAARVISRSKDIEALPPTSGSVRLYDAPRHMATLDLPRAYIGMQGRVFRGERPIARFRVIQRLSGKPIAIAEIVPVGDAAPTAGDAARSGD